MMRYGYARVSSKTQDYSAQVDALKAAGCERIFSEKRSGKSAKDRPEFSKLMRALVPGDTVVVSKLDRLARSSRDLHNILHELQERGCGFVSLGESWCDSTSEVGRLMLTIMGGIAEFERGLIRKRREEGIQRANALLARLDALISEEADDPAALTHEARQKAEAEVMGDLLAVERDEAALVWQAQSQSLLVEHRADISPLALLGLRLITAPRAVPPSTSAEHAYDIMRR